MSSRRALTTAIQDLVTRNFVRCVLLPNDFYIAYLNYPSSRSGKSKIVPNIVALPPNGVEDFDALVIKTAEDYAESEQEKGESKLNDFLFDIQYKAALKSAFATVGRNYGDLQTSRTLEGIGFSVKADSRLSWNPATIACMFRQDSYKRWSLGIFSDELSRLIPKIQGCC